MKTVMSPELVIGLSSKYLMEAKNGELWLCLDELENFVEIPIQKMTQSLSFWVEASTEQWKDRSGIDVEVRDNSYDYGEYKIAGLRERLEPAPLDFLVDEGFIEKDEWTKIYFRILYTN